MKSRHISKRNIHSFAAGATGTKKTEAIKQHLAGCSECQNELSGIEKLFKTLDKLPLYLPNEQPLDHCRTRLFKSLNNEPGRSSILSRLENMVSFIFGPGPSIKMVSAVTIFIMGLFLGQLIDFDSGIGNNQLPAAQLGFVESISFDDKSSLLNPVNIVLREDRTHTIAALPTDPKLIEVVIHILENEDRDDIRIKAVKILQNSGESEQVRSALLNRINKDSNPGIRLMAIKLLKKFPINDKVKQTLISAFFTDKNSGIRYEAKEILKTLPENPINNSEKTT